MIDEARQLETILIVYQRSKVNITQIRLATPWSLPLTVSRTSALSLMRTCPWKNTSRKCVSIRNIGMIRKHVNQPVAELLTHGLILQTGHGQLPASRTQQNAPKTTPAIAKHCCQTCHALQEMYSNHTYPQITTLATNRTENHLQNVHVCIQDNPRCLAYLLM